MPGTSGGMADARDNAAAVLWGMILFAVSEDADVHIPGILYSVCLAAGVLGGLKSHSEALGRYPNVGVMPHVPM
jgi:hypothetical protein